MSAKEIINLPETAIKDAYCRVYHRDSGNTFLSHLAAAVVSANEEDFRLIRPVALLFIDKYQLIEPAVETLGNGASEHPQDNGTASAA